MQKYQVERAIKGKENHYMIIEVHYSKGGMNYFTGTVEKRGIYISFFRAEKKGAGLTICITCPENFKILAKELRRRSQKEIDKVTSWVAGNTDKLLDLFEKNDKSTIFSLTKEQKF